MCHWYNRPTDVSTINSSDNAPQLRTFSVFALTHTHGLHGWVEALLVRECIMKRLVDRFIRRLRQRNDAGLTLLEVAASIGISVILALVVVLALTGLFSNAKHSNVVRTLGDVNTAANGYFSDHGGTFTGLDVAQVLSSQATGAQFTASPPAKNSDDIGYTFGTTGQLAVFDMYDQGDGACLYVADVTSSVAQNNITVLGTTVMSPGIFWQEDSGTCQSVPTGTWTTTVPKAPALASVVSSGSSSSILIPGGTPGSTDANAPTLTVTSFAPTTAPEGAVLTFFGTGFGTVTAGTGKIVSNVTHVTFGGEMGYPVSVTSPTHMKIYAPGMHPPGTVTTVVAVTISRPQQLAKAPEKFTYGSNPTVWCTNSAPVTVTNGSAISVQIDCTGTGTLTYKVTTFSGSATDALSVSSSGLLTGTAHNMWNVPYTQQISVHVTDAVKYRSANWTVTVHMSANPTGLTAKGDT